MKFRPVLALFAIVTSGCDGPELVTKEIPDGPSHDDGASVEAASPEGASPDAGPSDTGASEAKSDTAIAEAGRAEVGSEAPDAPPSCAAAAQGISVDEHELAGYPSYAVHGCRLAYVAPPIDGGSAGELRLRDLQAGTESVIAGAAESPRRPALSDRLLTWEATIDAKDVVRVFFEGTARTIEGPFARAAEPRAANDAVVFTGWAGADSQGDSDVFLYVPASGELTAVASGPSQQRFADVSDGYVAITDFSEDPDGRYDGDNDLADVIIYDRTTGSSTTRKRPGKQAFPLLAADRLIVYLQWQLGEVHPEPKLASYRLNVGPLFGTPDLDREIAIVAAQTPPYVRPAVQGDVVEWVDSPGGRFQLWRAPVDGSLAPASAFGPTSDYLYAPAPADRFTVLATRTGFAVGPRLASILR